MSIQGNPFRKIRRKMSEACRDTIKYEILDRVENLQAASGVDGKIAVVDTGSTFVVVPENSEIEYRLEEDGNSCTAPKHLWRKFLRDK